MSKTEPSDGPDRAEEVERAQRAAVKAAKPGKLQELPYALQQRLRMIDFMLDEVGGLNRSALVKFFGISAAQASNDMQVYRRLAPRNCHYDPSDRTYRRMPGFIPVWR